MSEVASRILVRTKWVVLGQELVEKDFGKLHMNADEPELLKQRWPIAENISTPQTKFYCPMSYVDAIT